MSRFHPLTNSHASATILFAALISITATTASCDLDDSPAGIAGAARLDSSWEPTVSPVKLTRESIADSSAVLTMGAKVRSAAADRATLDRAWYSRDGERYEALYISPKGEAYGRRGAASERPAPDEVVGLGSLGSLPDVGLSQAEIQAEIERLEDTGTSGSVPGNGPEETDGVTAGARIFTDWTIDRRSRQSSTITLESAPLRMVGALSGSGNTQSSGCTGTKIGPRAVLTAAHCVMDADGNISSSGRFNPGQTNTETPNGSLQWSGVFLRDWRIHRKYDYAVLFLADSASTVGLGWLGVAYWNSASGYTGRGASLHGYPCGPNLNCGAITEQRCKDSPRSDKRCDGWMYSHSADLWANSFRDDDLLQYDNDMSSGQSGSSVYVQPSPGDRRVVAVNTHSWNGVSMGPRFRASMWDDVCDWIAAVSSAHGSHSSCN